MSFRTRLEIGLVLVLIVWICLGVSRCRREATDAREAWQEVARLRATLAAHGIQPDLSESNLPEPHHTTHTP
jgi:hypothetical protein